MTTELEAAWATVPGLNQLTQAAAKLRTLAVTNTDAGHNLADQLADRLLSGGELPDIAEIGRMATTARQEALDRQAAKQVIAEASIALASRLESAKRDGAQTALNHLVDRLADVLAEVAELAPRLGAVRDRDTAWTAGEDVQDTWRKLEALNRTHEQIRSAQVTITTAITNSIRTPHGGTVALAEVARHGILDLAGLPTIANYTDQRDIHGYSVGRPQPWPADVEFGRRYSVAYLLWLNATPAAKPWLPVSLEQIEQAYDRHVKAQQQANNAHAHAGATF